MSGSNGRGKKEGSRVLGEPLMNDQLDCSKISSSPGETPVMQLFHFFTTSQLLKKVRGDFHGCAVLFSASCG